LPIHLAHIIIRGEDLWQSFQKVNAPFRPPSKTVTFKKPDFGVSQPALLAILLPKQSVFNKNPPPSFGMILNFNHTGLFSKRFKP